MMQQGLGALVPQQPAGQAPANPVRMAAAMDVVTSDAEENILDPRTLALIKYKDAVAAMQAADQLMAASQPTPTPPTVAERTKLAAQQGIMGLASRLAPGLQQQGARMEAQAQPEMAGGVAQLPAPNMAGMAGGGVVGYAEGGGPLPTAGGREDDYVVTYDELGNPIYASDIARAAAAGTTDTSEEGSALRAAYAALQRERPNLREIARTPERPSASRERVPTASYGMGDRTGQGEALAGMASGVAGSIRDGLGSLVPTGLSDEETAAETAVTTGMGAAEKLEAEKYAGVTRYLIEKGILSPETAAKLGFVGDMAVTSPTDAVRSAGALARVGVDATKLPLEGFVRAGEYGPTLEEIANVAVAGYRGEPSEQLPGMFERRVPEGVASESDAAATTPTAATPTATSGAATPAAADAVETLLRQPSPREMGPSATPAEYLRSQFRPAKTTAPTPQSRDDRMRRIIAGLRGLGAQGVGGFAAGVSEEELRMEQELIAEQERKRAADAETRGFDLEERGLTQRDAILRLEIENQQREAQQMMDLRWEQLAATHGAAVADAINEKTALYMPRAIELRTVLADPSYESGWLGNREELEAELAKLEATISATEAEVSALYGPAPTRATGTGVTPSGGFNSNDFTVRQVTP